MIVSVTVTGELMKSLYNFHRNSILAEILNSLRFQNTRMHPEFEHLIFRQNNGLSRTFSTVS